MTDSEGNTNGARVEEREMRSARTSGYGSLEELEARRLRRQH